MTASHWRRVHGCAGERTPRIRAQWAVLNLVPALLEGTAMRNKSIRPLLVPATALSRLPRSGFSGLLVLREVAKVLNVSVVTVRRRIRDGSLPALRIKGRLYVRPEELRAYVERHAEVPIE